jgi:hypothetical protein
MERADVSSSAWLGLGGRTLFVDLRCDLSSAKRIRNSVADTERYDKKPKAPEPPSGIEMEKHSNMEVEVYTYDSCKGDEASGDIPRTGPR